MVSIVQVDRALSEAEVCDVYALARAAAARADLLNVQDLAFYRAFHGSHGATLLAREAGQIIGFGLLGYPPAVHPLWHPYLADLGADAAACGCLVHGLVDPAYRGAGVGDTLCARRLDAARARGLEHVVATVDPRNLASLRVLQRHGLRALDVRRIYAGQVLRVLLYAPLRPRVAGRAG